MRSFEDELRELRGRALLRKLRTFDSPQGPNLSHAGHSLLSFASNDYLGLATEPALREVAKAAIDEFGVGSGASRLVCGTLAPHAVTPSTAILVAISARTDFHITNPH